MMLRRIRTPAWLERLLGRQRGYLAIAMVTAAILALLVVPVSPWILDVAIGASFLISLLLLTATLQVRRPTELSSFPALLLGATLLRLAISIASTRMILLDARAGNIIHAVGSVAAGENVVVGLVVFVVLGVVQFIVVAKGGDRVAEVAARFTLDGIPGRQMSVDADVRAGLLSASSAGARRREMERETYLYGAMDGAMKFVKGDSIATFLVAAVNLAGGILVGVLQRGLPVADALRSYTILTIGDGLVAQIPSLLSAIAAAILITRVCGTEEEEAAGDLGTQVASQLRQLPRGATAIVLLAVGALPGMPVFPFIPASVALGALTLAIQKRARINANSERAPMPAMTRDGGNYVPRILDDIELGTSAPLRVRLSPDALNAVAPEALNNHMMFLRRQLTLTTGSPFPGVCLLRDDLLPACYYVVDIEETPHESSTLVPGCVLVSSQVTPLPDAIEGYRPGYPLSRWLPPQQAAALAAGDVVSADIDQALCLHLLEICQQRAAHFFGLQDTRFLLAQLSR
ncbi:MAG TPA: FHIPEP family type III secretion protein, partial [Stenotrophomonas sp.]|nr:FHIPEP family type III secretion protein [Stenotrophomonas sp.]